MINKILLSLCSVSSFLILGCDDNDPIIISVVQDKTPYTMDWQGLPEGDLPTDNPLTTAGVQLGRMLFYDPILSKNSVQACATCHVQSDGFSDKNQFSEGVEKKLGKRQAMPIFNMAYHQKGFFWDGRAASLREQSLKPIQDALEMNETLPNVIAKLTAQQKYKDQFIRAFGDETIDEKRISLALEQFMFSIISGNSKFDQFKQGKTQLTDAEERGRKLFFTEFDPTGKVKGAECFHCHANANFTNDEFMNNGLDTDSNQKDAGYAEVTKNAEDKAKFKTPSLRNIAVTSPYMHDGRFKTLEEVVAHYNSGVKNSATVDILMQYNLQPKGLQLSTQEIADLVAFMKTLTDDNFLKEVKYKTPF
jgi:cytochrome c peroxidase